MGVGDRHSRRTSKSKDLLPAIRSLRRSYIVDDRELDDPFSAWDDDDAGARKPSPGAQRAHAAAAPGVATRLERKPAAGVDPFSKTVPVLVDPTGLRPAPRAEPAGAPPRDSLTRIDPVAMRDSVLSRARTLDEPRTARVLAQVARAPTPGELEPATSTRPTERVPPSKLPPALADARRDPPEPRGARDARDTRATRQELPRLGRRGARRPIARDEPFRKK